MELGGSMNLLDKILKIPNPPVYGTVSCGGGIIVSSKPACPKHGIKFYIEGYAMIGIAAGVNIVIFSIDLIKIELKVGAKVKLIRGYYSYHDVSWRRRCGCGERRRGWGNWSRRRRARWQSRWHNEICDVIVYAKLTITILCIRGWLLGEYYIRSKRFKLTLGIEYYEFWKLWWGNWVAFVKYVILDDR